MNAINSPSAARWPAIINPIAGFTCARGMPRRPQHERENGNSDRLMLAACTSDRIAGDDVTELVGDHALDLVHIVRDLDQAGLKIDRLSLRDEGVDLGIIEKHDLDAVWVEPGRDDQGPRHVVEQALGLGIAQDLRAGIVSAPWRAASLQRPASARSSAGARSGKPATSSAADYHFWALTA